jgi:hypothetical protein
MQNPVGASHSMKHGTRAESVEALRHVRKKQRAILNECAKWTALHGESPLSSHGEESGGRQGIILTSEGIIYTQSREKPPGYLVRISHLNVRHGPR